MNGANIGIVLPETKNRPRSKGKITYTDGREEMLEYGAEKIDAAEYKGRNDIVSILLPNSVESIGYDAFAECTELKTVVLQNGVKEIGHYAFRDCPKLEGITFSDDLENIGADIFLNCTSLCEVFVPEKAKFNIEQPFQGCECKVTVHAKNPYYKVIDGDVYSADGKTLVAHIPAPGEKSYTIPEGVEKIGSYAFSRCVNIAEITMPGGVTAIETSAFSGCQSLESIKIPEGVSEIGSTAFYGCEKLESAYIPASVKAIGFAAFDRCLVLKEFLYGGKKSEWKKIKVENRNDLINGKTSARAKVVFA